MDTCQNPLDSAEVARRRDFAQSCIRRYFSSKSVPESDFSDPKYLDLCLETDTCSAMDKAYKAMSRTSRFKDDGSHPVEKDVRFVIKTLEGMSKVVPQEFSAGILLMHLEIIEKISL